VVAVLPSLAVAVVLVVIAATFQAKTLVVDLVQKHLLLLAREQITP
jgi:hypothetical protein